VSRAHGKHTSRKPSVEVKPGTPEGDYYGISDRQQGQASPRIAGEGSPIPGGREHIGNYPTQVQKVPTPEPRDTYRGVMAHGVAPEFHDAHERHDRELGPSDIKPLVPTYAGAKPAPPVPVPVYIVSQRGGPRPLRIATTKHLTVPGFNNDPQCLVGKDFNRTKVRIMNTDATNAVRIASSPGELVQDPGTSGATIRSIGGALLPKAMTSYQDIETQDELWAITMHATATVELDIIVESSVANAGGQV